MVVDELDETVSRVRALGPMTLPLDGWDRASIWGWDESTSSLYAYLWRNTDDPTMPPTIRIEPDDYTPAITLLPTLAQHIAMVADRRPWKVLTILDRAVDQDEDDEDQDAEAGPPGTVVTMTEGYGIWWPPNFGSERRKPA
jgi:hypothetical protein